MNPVTAAYAGIEAYRAALAHLAAAERAMEAVPEHRAEYQCSKCPGDLLKDTAAAVEERITALQTYIGYQERDAA